MRREEFDTISSALDVAKLSGESTRLWRLAAVDTWMFVLPRSDALSEVAAFAVSST